MAQKVAAEAAPTGKSFLQEGLSPRTPVFDEAKGHSEGCSGNPEPLVLDDAKGRGGSRSGTSIDPSVKNTSNSSQNPGVRL